MPKPIHPPTWASRAGLVGFKHHVLTHTQAMAGGNTQHGSNTVPTSEFWGRGWTMSGRAGTLATVREPGLGAGPVGESWSHPQWDCHTSRLAQGLGVTDGLS